jgi:hypothetical protein
MSTVLRHSTARTQACKPQGGNQARTGENKMGAWVNVIHKVYVKYSSINLNNLKVSIRFKTLRDQPFKIAL